MKSLSVVLYLIVSGLFLWSCTSSVENSPKEKEQSSVIIGKPDVQVTSDRMTPEVLWAFGRVSGQEVSPDGNTVMYGVSYYSIDQNSGNRELYAVDIDGGNFRQLTHSSKSEFNAVWRPDGEKIGFLSSESGSVQLWEMNPDGSTRTQISDIDGGITGFKYAADQQKILFTKEVPIENKFADLYEGLPKASGKLMDDLMYRHWDHWVESYSHVFYANYDGTKVWNEKDILEGETYQSPLKPFGGIEQVDRNPVS